MKEKFIQRRITDYLGWLKIRYIHLTNFLSTRIWCPYCHRSFNKKITIPGNKGLPDLIIWIKNKPLIIELKSKKGKLTKEQREYIEYLEKKGYNVPIIRKFDDFVKILNDRHFKK